MKFTSKQNYILNNQVDKRFLLRKIFKDLGEEISIFHLTSIVNLLFEEISISIKKNNKIEIGNFGTLSLVEISPRKHINIVSKKMEISKGSKKMKFKLSNKLKKKLVKFFWEVE